jgi:hypothetical protein
MLAGGDDQPLSRLLDRVGADPIDGEGVAVGGKLIQSGGRPARPHPIDQLTKTIA